MPIKNLSYFSNHWAFWGFVSILALGGSLLNAWLGFPFPAPFEGVYCSIGGVIPYSDAEVYLSGAHRFIENGYLDSWNLRRPLTTLLLAFYLKITNFNFWSVMIIQMGVCAFALTIYLKTLRQDLGILAVFIALIFLYYYAQIYIQTTLSEIPGLSLGLFSFVLLWNGWIDRNRFIFNIGMATLAIALSARAGPNFMVFGLLLLIFWDPFTQSRYKDLFYSILSFGLPSIVMTKLSTFFGSPEGGGMALSNFGLTLYGLVAGGKGWLYASVDPDIQGLLNGKGEAQQAIILYKESWRSFISNPFNLIIGVGKYLGAFFAWFIRLFSFGEGLSKVITTITSIFIWGFIGFQIFNKRYLLNRGYLFLIVVFASIAASSMIIFKDAGMRTFAVAIPFMGALFGFAFTSISSDLKERVTQNILASSGVAIIVFASLAALYLPSKMKTPDISQLIANKIPGQETFLTYNLNRQPYLLIEAAPGLHFRTLSSDTIKQAWSIYYRSDKLIAKDLINIVKGFTNNNLVLFQIYDYISHSSKWLLAENHILNFKAEWIEIHANIFTQDFNKVYVANSFKEPS